MAHGAEEVRAFTRKCIFVFVALMALTVVTVAISYLELATPAAIAVGLLVAITKGSLVALFFMHLIDERKIVYYTMALTFAFFGLVMYLPSAWDTDLVIMKQVWSVLPQEGSATHVGGGHHGDAHGEAHGDDAAEAGAAHH